MDEQEALGHLPDWGAEAAERGIPTKRRAEAAYAILRGDGISSERAAQLVVDVARLHAAGEIGLDPEAWARKLVSLRELVRRLQ